MNNKTTSDGETSRRDFLKTSSTAAVASAATLSLISRGTAYGQNSDTIRVGLVGCGGRGTGAANQALSADDNVKLTAVADVFPDKVDRAVNGLKKRHEKKVDVPHQFVGLDAYQKLIDSGVDLVVLATPPGFRPLHFRAVVEAGKHCFIEKPMATDGPGARSVIASIAKAKAGRVGNMVTLRCVELCGSLGYGETELLEKWARDSKILDIFEGTQQIQLLIIARRLLGKSSAELK